MVMCKQSRHGGLHRGADGRRAAAGHSRYCKHLLTVSSEATTVQSKHTMTIGSTAMAVCSANWYHASHNYHFTLPESAAWRKATRASKPGMRFSVVSYIITIVFCVVHSESAGMLQTALPGWLCDTHRRRQCRPDGEQSRPGKPDVSTARAKKIRMGKITYVEARDQRN